VTKTIVFNLQVYDVTAKTSAHMRSKFLHKICIMQVAYCWIDWHATWRDDWSGPSKLQHS